MRNPVVVSSFARVAAGLAIIVTSVLVSGCSESQRPKVAEGQGTVTINITSPVEQSGTSKARIICARLGKNYNVLANNVTVEGLGITFNVTTSSYDGPGDYTATTTLLLNQGDAAAIKTGTPMPATLDDDGGTVTVDNRGGVSGTISWTCP